MSDYNFNIADFFYGATLFISAFLVLFFIVEIAAYSEYIEDESKECRKKGGYYMQTAKYYYHCVDRKLIIEMEKEDE